MLDSNLIDLGFKTLYSLLAMIAHSAVQSSTWTLFTMLFCLQTSLLCLINEAYSLIGTPYLTIIASNASIIVLFYSTMSEVIYYMIHTHMNTLNNFCYTRVPLHDYCFGQDIHSIFFPIPKCQSTSTAILRFQGKHFFDVKRLIHIQMYVKLLHKFCQ